MSSENPQGVQPTAAVDADAVVKPKGKPRGRPFLPGQSGNPAGRPRGRYSFQHLLDNRLDDVATAELRDRLANGAEGDPSNYPEGWLDETTTNREALVEMFLGELIRGNAELFKEWLSREWPKKTTLDVNAEVSAKEDRTDAPLIPADTERRTEVAKLLSGLDDEGE